MCCMTVRHQTLQYVVRSATECYSGPVLVVCNSLTMQQINAKILQKMAKSTPRFQKNGGMLALTDSRQLIKPPD